MTRESRLFSTNLRSNQQKKSSHFVRTVKESRTQIAHGQKTNFRPSCTEKLFGSQNFKCWGLVLSRDRGGAPSAPGWRRFNLIKTQRVAIYCLLPSTWPLTCVPENSFNCDPSSSGSLVVYNPGTSGIVKSDEVQAFKKLEKAKFSQSRRSLEISYRSSVSSHRRPLHLSLHCLA